jgi:hydroxyacylglutathione hydrolase
MHKYTKNAAMVYHKENIVKKNTEDIAMSCVITSLPALSDNYIHIIEWGASACVVDPTDSGPVFEYIERKGLTLEAILITHHHQDHIGGVHALKDVTCCAVIGPDDVRLPEVDKAVVDGEEFSIGVANFVAIHVPGHTTTQMAYRLLEGNALFCGDFLFSAGCGRIFEGTPQQMLASIRKIEGLPDETLLYFGHDYASMNMLFAYQVEPENGRVVRRKEEVEVLREREEPALPTTLEQERAFNPFLRVHSTMIRRYLQMEGGTDLEVFTALREIRNAF